MNAAGVVAVMENGIGEVERKVQKSYWEEHSRDLTVESMMLDSNAADLDKEERPEVLSILPSYQGKSVLELGAGIGRFTGELAKEAGHVLALDFIESVIKKNEDINSAHKNITFMCADVTSPELKIEDNSIDLVFSNWLLMYLSDEEVEKLIGRIVKWLKVGGHIFIRESCFHQSGDSKRKVNPTHYREPRFYTKGSTCTFAESILRSCGFRTGLFTSPHLMDVRERFRLDGLDISEEKFIRYFWWCWNRLKVKTGDDIPMPAYFRFLALLAFKIFSDEQVDVAVLEVGLGGRYDATNVVKAPVVCGISSLGYDHMEILGHTLGEIAGEKAGILKKGVPAYTVPQPEEAMSVLKNRASELGVSIRVVPPLDPHQLEDQPLGLHGEHQYMNAGLAVALANTWLERQGHLDKIHIKHSGTLPDQFIEGLSSACLQGRAQIVSDPEVNSEYVSCPLVFYLDGAHSPESMEMCARWFSHVTKKDLIQPGSLEHPRSGSNSKKILLFNCMSVRDPERLLPGLLDTCVQNGLHFDQALFVPNQSQYNKLGSHASPPSEREQIDLSWQLSLQSVWENLLHSEKGLNGASSSRSSLVFESLPLAIKWLRETAQQNQSTSYQVLVTGSLHLVGDVLRLIKK